MEVTSLNRVELVVPRDTLEAVVKTFSDILGIALDPPVHHADYDILSTTSWDAGIEISAPASASSPLQNILDAAGENAAVGPVVWNVDSVDEARAQAESLGVKVAYELDMGDGMRQIGLSPDDCYGYAVSFIEGAPASRAASLPGSRINRLNRIEFLLPAQDIPQAVEFFRALLGIDMHQPDYLPEHHVLTTTCWEAGLELFGPGDEESVLYPMLELKGSRGGTGPIVWEVPDMDALKAAAVAQGHKPVYEFSHDNRHQVVLDAETFFGYQATFTQYLS